MPAYYVEGVDLSVDCLLPVFIEFGGSGGLVAKFWYVYPCPEEGVSWTRTITPFRGWGVNIPELNSPEIGGSAEKSCFIKSKKVDIAFPQSVKLLLGKYIQRIKSRITRLLN